MEAERVPMINGAAAPPAKPVLVVVAASFVMAFYTVCKGGMLMSLMFIMGNLWTSPGPPHQPFF
jgi:hypothetical protein